MLLDCCRWTTFEGSEYDDLPQIVCKVCFGRLKQSWLFVSSICDAQQRLLSYMHNGVIESIEIQSLIGDDSMCVAFDFKTDDDDKISTNYDCDDNDHIDGEGNFENIEINDEFNAADANDSVESQKPQQCRKSELNDAEVVTLSSIVVDKRFKLLKHIHKDERNTDGTITLEGVQRLQLLDWTILKYRCFLCKSIEECTSALRRHIREQHFHEEFRYFCVICSKEFQFPGSLSRHVMNCHFRYLEHW